MNIFLSHASQDKNAAEEITFSLRSRGHKVFLDRDDLPAGESYDQRIERAVKNSDIFVFLISPDSVAEGRYTLTELSFARRRWDNPTGRILPVMARKTPLDKVPAYLRAVTILEPVGSVTAETCATVHAMSRAVARGSRLVAGLVLGLLILLAGLYLFYLRLDHPPPVPGSCARSGLNMDGISFNPANDKYRVIVNFIPPRRQDAESLVKALGAAGFASRPIETDLKEVITEKTMLPCQILIKTDTNARQFADEMRNLVRRGTGAKTDDIILFSEVASLTLGDIQIDLY